MRGVGPETGGLMAIGAGLAFVLERFGAIQNAWHWLPLFAIYLAARDLADPVPGTRRTAVPLLGAIWLQMAAIGFLGVDFVNGWPLLVILAGVGLLVDGILESDRWRARSARQERP